MGWIEEFFYAISEDIQTFGDSLNDIADGINELILNINTYIEMSTYYIYISGAMLFILFIMLCVVINKLSWLKKDHKALQEEIRDLNNILKKIYPEELETFNSSSNSLESSYKKYVDENNKKFIY
ncbi:MAG: hypothetical protein E7222_04230 [Clostridiales bacterium]|nr:hypothetical protein [Clostridiales bacterium]